MEKAKAAVSDFLSKDGHHKTTVDQDTSAAITEEHVKPHRHENVTTAIDREVHKDHHYTTVQPVTHKETLPEQHHHNIIPVEHKSVDHGGHKEMLGTLERDRAQYKDTSTTHQTTHSQSTVPMMSGEHVHHHVHEHVQPVIQKDTIQPHVVHTTIPVHETHKVAPVHHGTKIAPTKTLDEFTKAGGLMEGRATKELHEYDGCPQTEGESHSHSHGKSAAGVGALGGALAAHEHDKHASRDSTTLGTNNADRLADTLGTHNRENTSLDSTAREGHIFGKDKVSPTTTESQTFLKKDRRSDDLTNSNYATGTMDSKINKEGAFGGPAAIPRSEHDHTTDSKLSEPWRAGETHQDAGLQKRASLVDKINPFKDADGDGKKGFMK